MEQMVVAGLRIAYQRAGEGPPLVLLHGGLSDCREWRRQFDALANEFTVVAWDAPGCGQSADPPETFRLPAYADCLAAFIDALGLEHPHMLGLSFGGGLALEFYRRHPTVPRTLALASAYAGWAGSLPAEEVEDRLTQIVREVDLPLEQWIPAWSASLFTEAAPQEMIEEMAAIMSAFHPAGVRAMVHAFAEADLRDILPLIQVPTLLLYGDADQRIPAQVAEDLHARIPTARLVILRGAGHQCNVEAAERFTTEVRSFLRSVQP
ncbi:MAG TPA: alpha/beta hydrolase [Ktedonobacterales bacterium]|jgi:pimeloyl-ACP methyl ester carboxylesterase|nr:alpha/beta hydrolase [Ktedonobacterales bacterium]